MSQSDVLKYMRKHKGWISLKELSEKLNQGKSSLSANTNALFKQGYLVKKVVNCTNHRYNLYKLK